ncbi:MAG: hypothetical protein HYT83_03690 [Candidatus Levybacteria bacterium]|nr:hypothetical protein [Candidatus Levybacteria bacterium]
MKFVFTKHLTRDKLPVLKEFGWKVTKVKIKEIIKNSQWHGITRYGEKTAMGLVDSKHILRVIYRKENDIITVITVHIARRGKYGSTL